MVAVSGDLTQRARNSEFAEARHFLERISAPVLVVPGNHDVPLYDVARRFLRPLARYREFVTSDLEPVYVDDEVAVMGLNSARSLTFGRGRLNARQISRAAERLRDVDPRLIKIIVTHHPFDLPDAYGDEHLVGRARPPWHSSPRSAPISSSPGTCVSPSATRRSATRSPAQRARRPGRDDLRGCEPSQRVQRGAREPPHISVERRAWDEGADLREGTARTFRHTDEVD
jgi:hypothetical protein